MMVLLDVVTTILVRRETIFPRTRHSFSPKDIALRGALRSISTAQRAGPCASFISERDPVDNEFHLDGLRLDAVHTIRDEVTSFLDELTARVHHAFL